MKHSINAFLGFLLLTTIPAHADTYALGTSAITAGPTAASNSVVLAVSPETAVWTASENASWLHLDVPFQSGTGSTNVIFSLDANPGTTRSGTLTIAGQTLTVTQAGSTYNSAALVGILVSSGLNTPVGVTVDAGGNVYIADTFNNAIKEWIPASNSVNTVVSTGLNSSPQSVAVDPAGNLYIGEGGTNKLNEWTATNGALTTLVSSMLSNPTAVALDDAGSNVYFTSSSFIKKWSVADNTVTTVVSSGLSNPAGVAVDIAGDVYIADTFHNAIKVWTAANNSVTTLVSSGLNSPHAVAVDGEGNVYIADTGHATIKRWMAANSTVATLVSSGLNSPDDLAVDSAGNVYIADSLHSEIKELQSAFVDSTGKLEGLGAGNDELPPVLPATANLLTPFAPTSDQSWLTITGITNGAVSFAFTANTGAARTAHINLLGHTISIIQGLIGTPPRLTGLQTIGNGTVQFTFTNNPSASFTVLSTTNLSLPLANWTAVGAATNISSNLFQFTSQPTTTDQKRYYTVRSP